MARGIAVVALSHGIDVVLWGRDQARARAATAGIVASAERRTPSDGTIGELSVAPELAGLNSCALVIESISEDLAAKQTLLTQLDEACPAAVALATNTSTLSVATLAESVGSPERICGLHFSNPPERTTVVELVTTESSSSEALAVARAFAERCGKTIVDVNDSPGFIINALLFPFLNAAVRLLESGVADRESIDLAMEGACNHAMGPLRTLDLVGLDTSLSILEVLHSASGRESDMPAGLLRELVSLGKLGRKTGSGFYDY